MARGTTLPDSFEQALRTAARILSANHELVSRNLVDTESEQLVIAAYRKATGKRISRMDLFARIRDRFPEQAGEHLLNLASLRAEGRPLQHLIGTQAFLDHEYEVGPDVLIPRPETEILVSIAMQKLRDLGPRLGFEIGLGSGVISIELLAKFPKLRMAATELTAGARELALRNAEKVLGPEKTRLQILNASAEQVLEPFQSVSTERADFLISNPPYLVSPLEVDAEVLKYEPHTALFAPKVDPVYFYRKIAEGTPEMLNSHGQVFLEIPHERAYEIAALFPKPLWDAKLFTDLNGRERVLCATLS